LLVLISGAPCSGKSTIATLLAERLNLPSVLQTDIMHDLLLFGENMNSCNGNDDDRNNFHDACSRVEHGLFEDLRQIVASGKSLIAEGKHIRPSFGRQVEREFCQTVLKEQAAVVVQFLLNVGNEATYQRRRTECSREPVDTLEQALFIQQELQADFSTQTHSHCFRVDTAKWDETTCVDWMQDIILERIAQRLDTDLNAP
jgi:2-phosphoglycerate kinase